MELETIFQGEMTPLKWRMLGDYLKGSKVHAGTGMRLENSGTSGTMVSAIPRREIKNSQAPPFSVLSLREVVDSNPVRYRATLQEGWVITRLTQIDTDAVQFDEVYINASPMSTRPREEISLESGDFVQVQYATTDEGTVDGVPAIIVGQEEESTHHQPPSGAGTGAPGSYYVKLFQFVIDDGSPKIIYYQQSDIHNDRLWTGENVGGARYIHKQWNGTTDRYEFRTLEQVDVPVGRDGGRVIVDADPADEFDDANDAIKFSCLVERLEDPQINIEDDGGGEITIKGNNNSNTLRFEDCSGNEIYTLEWEDGLVTSGLGTVVVPSCNSGGGAGP